MIRLFQQDNRATKAIFAIVIGGAIVTMVVTLVPGIFDNGDANNSAVYATVRSPGLLGRFGGDSKTITTEEVNRAAQGQLQRQQLPAFLLPYMVSQAGQALVERAILEREADRLGLSATDDDLKHELQYGQYGQLFYPNGKFVGKDQYISILSNAQISAVDFENEIKSQLELERLEALVTGGLTVSDNTVRDEFRRQGTKVKFDYAVISSSDIKSGINASDDDLQAFFKQNIARYATAVPEQRKISFISFDGSNLPGGQAPVSDSDVQAYYNAHLAQYKVEAQVQTRHILIPVAKGADAKTDAAAKAKAQDVLNQIKAGGNFAELAKKYSEDPGSKDKGGELPMIATAQLDQAYANAALALNPGQTSDLVRSQFGYHIIQTEAKQTEHTKPLAEVHDSIVPVLQQQKQGTALQNYGNQLAAEAKKNGLQKTADAHGLHVTTTDYVGRDGVIGTLADSSALLQTAFAASKGAAPAAASTGEGYAVFQVDDIRAAHAPDFAAYKPTILNDYREQKAPELLNNKLKALDDRAKVLNDVKKAAAEMNVPVKSSDLVGKDGQVPDVGSMAQQQGVFDLAKGGVSGPINTGTSGIVLQLTDKQEPTTDEIAKNFSATRESMLSKQRQELFDVYAQTLMARYQKAGAIVASAKKAPASPFGK